MFRVSSEVINANEDVPIDLNRNQVPASDGQELAFDTNDEPYKEEGKQFESLYAPHSSR